MALVGPGAIGGAIAGALIEAGIAPVVCARTGFTHLTVDHPGGQISAPVDCRTAPSAMSPVDLLILAVKAHQTEQAGGWLSALIGPGTVLVVAQNGVEQFDRVAPLISAGTTVVPAAIWCPARRSAPGRIEVTGRSNLVVPEGPGSSLLAEALDGSFFGVRISADFTTRAWDKLLVNAALGGVGVLTGLPGGALARDPELRDLMLAVMAEIVPVARAEGAIITDERPAEVLDAVIDGGADHLSSIAVDRLAGLPTEWDARNAVIGRLAAKHGLGAPLNRWLTALIRAGEPGETGDTGDTAADRPG